MEFLLELDHSLFFLINGWRATWADPIMDLISEKWSWIPAYLALLIALHRKLGLKRLGVVLLCVAGLILFTDRVSAGLLKPSIKRLRPCHAALAEPVYLVDNHCGGKYGFVSSHAANFFGLATFMSLLWGSRRLSAWFLGLASLVAYSRVYLGVHYPGDVLAGALLGVMGGWLLWQLAQYLMQRVAPLSR